MTNRDESLAGASILVTGGTGFVGSAFVRHAVTAGSRVTVVARPGADHWRLAPVTEQYVRWTGPLAQLASDARLEEAAIRVVVHCAAAGVDQRFDDVAALVEANVVGTLHALEFAHRVAASRFVLIGTSGEYGPGERLDEDQPLRPTSEYGASRAAATMLARTFSDRRGLDVCVVRPFAVYGPYEAAYRLIPYCILGGLRGDSLEISSGVQTRDYVHVHDVAVGIGRACVANAARGGTFNLCTGIATAVRDAAVTVVALTGGRSLIEAGKRPTIPGEMWRTSGAPEHARNLLGWSAERSLASGLAETVAWFRQEGVNLPAYRLTA